MTLSAMWTGSMATQKTKEDSYKLKTASVATFLWGIGL